MKGEIISEIIYFNGFVHPHMLKLIIQNTTPHSGILSKRFHMCYTATRISKYRNCSLLQGFSSWVWCQLHTNFESPLCHSVGADVYRTDLLGWEDEIDVACELNLTGINTHTPHLSCSVSVITVRTVCHISGTHAHAHGDSFL